MVISYIDLVDFLSGNGMCASATGQMLDKVRDGIAGTFGNGKNNEDLRALSQAGILKCIDELRKTDKIEFEKCSTIRKFCKKSNYSEGASILAVLSAYYQWYLKSEERGLVEVYRLLQRMDSSLEEPVHDESELTQAFRLGKSKMAREISSKMLRESMIVADTWVNLYNDKKKKEGKRVKNG